MALTLSQKEREPVEYVIPAGMEYTTSDEFIGPRHRPGYGHIKTLKCQIAEAAWIQRTIGGPIGVHDWCTLLHARLTHVTGERSWERFKKKLLIWQVPHERILLHFPNVGGKGHSTAIIIRILLAPELMDDWFLNWWGIEKPPAPNDTTGGEPDAGD